MIQPYSNRLRAGFAISFLLAALLACSGINDVIGQRPARPTPTPPSFATATPGGRAVGLLGTQSAPSGPSTTPVGQIVAPAATATALWATLQAATATAAATPALPLFMPDQCPVPGAPPPPDQPTAFSLYPEAVGRYLSVGGSPVLLEGYLREWGTMGEGSVVQSNTDLTGDGIAEILVALYDPTTFSPDRPSPGQLLVFGCAQGGYRLLYATPFSPGNMLPVLRRVGDMNGDTRAELVYSQQSCAGASCEVAVQVLSWSAALGVFKPLNELPISASGGKVVIADYDGDGVLEVGIDYNLPMSAASGPTRPSTDFWDWDGLAYRLAMTQVGASVYRIHALHDADMWFAQEAWDSALRAYTRVRDDEKLQGWTNPTEPTMLRAYALYKRILAQAANGQRTNANRTLETLRSENPPGTPGEGYALIGGAFMDNFNKTRSRAKACVDALAVAATRPETVGILNGFGYANRTYSYPDLCPFR